MQSNQFYFSEYWTFPDASPDEVWAVIADPKLTSKWWHGVYLESQPLDSNYAKPYVGLQTRVVARGFLPYKVKFITQAEKLQPGKLIEVKTVGDFEGIWRAIISKEVRGTRVDIDWTVTVQKPFIRLLSPILKPLFAWNHYWTTPRGEAGLRVYLKEQRQKKYKGITYENQTQCHY
jgi:hypothetical protein